MELNSKILLVKWDSGDEYIDLRGVVDGGLGSVITTEELRDGSQTFVFYEATISRLVVSPNEVILRLDYKKNEDQPPDTNWGRALYTIDESFNVRCEWEFYKDGSWNDESEPDGHSEIRCSILDDGSLGRVASLIRRPLRDSTFRKCVLAKDNHRCVVSGESTDRVLEAAHLVAVGENGSDQRDNGIALRNDLHKLFDAGYFWICHECGTVHFVDNLSEDYKEFLAERRIPNETLERVAVNLEKRNSNTQSNVPICGCK